MANSYINIVLHLVFAVKNRRNLIANEHLPIVHKYIAGSFSKRGHAVIEIGGTSNHIHVLFQYNAKELLSDLIRDIKSSSSAFIAKNGYSYGSFNWQRGYGCFSADSGNLENLRAYIRNQKQHHGEFEIKEELRRLLRRCGMEYKEEYLFEDV
ncbi:MAG: IS200/IS605 family transposase [Muribaculaceae bacterium]|nr:IS200/IS605 family transposase [Muribaculaceae bacterium]